MEGMIFGWLGAKMEHWIFKPVAMCLPCMASVWSIILLQRVDIKAMLEVAARRGMDLDSHMSMNQREFLRV